MNVLYKQIINGIEYLVCLAPHEYLKKEMTGNENSKQEYYGFHYSRKRLIIIADDLDEEQAVRTYAHEYTHAHRFCLGYDTQNDSIDEEALCDYIMMNYETIYHMAEHFRKHIKEHIDKQD